MERLERSFGCRSYHICDQRRLRSSGASRQFAVASASVLFVKFICGSWQFYERTAQALVLVYICLYIGHSVYKKISFKCDDIETLRFPFTITFHNGSYRNDCLTQVNRIDLYLCPLCKQEVSVQMSECLLHVECRIFWLSCVHSNEVSLCILNVKVKATCQFARAIRMYHIIRT